jgi:DNA helicase-2/ATP-dependent DNA helicase PcrA
VKTCKSDKEYYDELRNLISDYGKRTGLTAIICRNQYNVDRIAEKLGKDAPVIVAENDALPKEGVFLIDLPLAKGLEFDNVILADVDKDAYPSDILGKHCLYTAMSRATQHLAILANGELSENL